jgi:hypothetical protein
MRRRNRLLLFIDDGDAPVLRDPSRGIILRREAIRLLNKVAEPGYPYLVGLPVLEDLVSCVAHLLDHPGAMTRYSNEMLNGEAALHNIAPIAAPDETWDVTPRK